jgi:hypothetical protein
VSIVAVDKTLAEALKQIAPSQFENHIRVVAGLLIVQPQDGAHQFYPNTHWQFVKFIDAITELFSRPLSARI